MKYMNILKKHSAKIGVAVSTVAASGVAHAVDLSEELGTAVSSGQSNYTVVVVGLIGLAAIGFGLRAIVSAMR